MNISNFLFIDGIVILIVLSIFLIKKSIDNQNKPKVRIQELPSQEKLLDLELLAKKEGSGIEFNSLIGTWKFISVWKKNEISQDKIASYLLRLFSASLEIKDKETNDGIKFNIKNSIQFEILSIKFVGGGYLKGKQPLLYFYFEKIEVSINNIILYSKSLEIPDEKLMPFFALIYIDMEKKLLSARGRGGGLAIWSKS